MKTEDNENTSPLDRGIEMDKLAMERESKMHLQRSFYENTTFEERISGMNKTLDNENIEKAKAQIPDIKVFGNGDLFELICKASSKKEGWMKSTKAMDTGNGCLVQVTTQQGDNVAEALAFVPGVKILTDQQGNKYLSGGLAVEPVRDEN